MGVLLHWATRGPGRGERTAAYEATLPTERELSCGVLMSEEERGQLQDPALAVRCADAHARAAAVGLEARGLLRGRGLHSSTFQLNLSRVSSNIHPEHPLLPPNTS
jgi:hypothetical protein